MCGIAGALFFDQTDAESRCGLVSSMVNAVGHRGPDGRGVVDCAAGSSVARPATTLGHTRLAILDLSDRGAQPMRSPRVPVWLTYNGEVYNFDAIRSELERAGRAFESRSDTEVVLQAYEEWGAGMVDRLRGMFALAIWDGRTGELLLVRDRLGIKPLYLYRDDRCLLFASEIRALLATGRVPRQLDQIAADQYLSYQTVPSPRTLVKNVRMLRPGHLMQVRGPTGSTEEREYWHLLDSRRGTGKAPSASDARAEIRRLLVESMRLHLVSDVPVGLFLSGGIDSSALVALAREAGVQPRTFTVVLPGSGKDEAPFARSVAARFGAEHTEIGIGEQDLRDQMAEAIASVDHPSGDGFNTFVVSRAVRSAGIKVALSGLGGDELFGGYPSFRRLSKLAGYARLWKRSPMPLRHAAATAVRALGRSSIATEKAAALLETDGTLSQTFPLMRQLFSEPQRRALLGDEIVNRSERSGDPYVALIEEARLRRSDLGLISLVGFAEARTYMHDVLLRDTDQMSMAHGLEVRVPLLDHVLADYVMELPDAIKKPGAVPKRLLVESLGAELPAECVHRPKQGFVLPFDAWMKSDLRAFCEHHLGSSGLAGRGLFRESAIRNLWESFMASDGRTTWSRPWALVALDAWIDRNAITV